MELLNTFSVSLAVLSQENCLTRSNPRSIRYFWRVDDPNNPLRASVMSRLL